MPLFPDLVEQELPSWELTSATVKPESFCARKQKIWDIYLRLLVKVHRFLAQPSTKWMKRLFMSCINQSPLYLSWMIWEVKLPDPEGKTTVVIGTITNVVHVQMELNWRCVHFLWAAVLRATCSKPGARCLPSTSWL